MQSVAVLEEYLNNYYIGHYEEFSEADNKAEALEQYTESSNWIWNPSKNGYGVVGYVVNKDGNACYLINKKALPEEIKSQLKGGDAGDDTYADYVNMNDVYGVTGDLKVYYCKDGKESILGISGNELDYDNPLREVFPAGSSLATLITGNNTENVTAEDVKSIKSLNIDSSSGVTNLKDLYNLTSLQRLTLENVSFSTLDGIDNAPQLNYIMLKGCKIENYSAIGRIGDGLKYLYLYNTTDSEVEKLCNLETGIGKYDLPNLEYFAITGNETYISQTESDGPYSSSKSENTITNISPLNNLTDTTKKAIKYLSLQNNNIESIEDLKDFSSVYLLRVECNKLTSLAGCENMQNLTYLYACENNLGANEVYLGVDENEDGLDDGRNASTDALACLSGKNNLYYVHLIKNTNLIWIDYLKDSTSINKFFLAGCSKLNSTAVANIATIFNNCLVSNRSIDSIYEKYLATSEEMYFSGLTPSSTTDIDYLKNMSEENKAKVKKLDLSNSTLENEELNEIISGFTNLVTLNVDGCSKLTSLDFLENTSKLEQICFNNTGIVGNEVSKLDMYTTNLKSFRCNNPEIDITKMQKTISNTRCYAEKYSFQTYLGAGFQEDSLIEQLANCTEITYIATNGQKVQKNLTVDLSNCKKLKSAYFQGSGTTFILPTSFTELSVWWPSFENLIYRETTHINNISISQVSTGLTNVKKLLESLATTGSVVNSLTLNFRTTDSAITEDLLKYLSQIQIKSLKFNTNGSKVMYPFVTESWNGYLKNISSLTINYGNIDNLDFLSENANLTSLSITNSGLNNINGIENLINFTTIDFSNNNISSLYSLRNMNKLESLNLNNNLIYDTSVNAQGESFKNLEILRNLNLDGALKKLYISGNDAILDWSLVNEDCKWEEYNGK